MKFLVSRGVKIIKNYGFLANFVFLVVDNNHLINDICFYQSHLMLHIKFGESPLGDFPDDFYYDPRKNRDETEV